MTTGPLRDILDWPTLPWPVLTTTEHLMDHFDDDWTAPGQLNTSWTLLMTTGPNLEILDWPILPWPVLTTTEYLMDNFDDDWTSLGQSRG